MFLIIYLFAILSASASTTDSSDETTFSSNSFPHVHLLTPTNEQHASKLIYLLMDYANILSKQPTSFGDALKDLMPSFNMHFSKLPIQSWCHHFPHALAHVSSLFPTDNQRVAEHQKLLILYRIAACIQHDPTASFLLSQQPPTKESLLTYLSEQHSSLRKELHMAHTFSYCEFVILYSKTPDIVPLIALAGRVSEQHIILFPNDINIIGHFETNNPHDKSFIFDETVGKIIQQTKEETCLNSIQPNITSIIAESIVEDIINHEEVDGPERALMYALAPLRRTSLDLSSLQTFVDSITSFTTDNLKDLAIYWQSTEHAQKFFSTMQPMISASLKRTLLPKLLSVPHHNTPELWRLLDQPYEVSFINILYNLLTTCVRATFPQEDVPFILRDLKTLHQHPTTHLGVSFHFLHSQKSLFIPSCYQISNNIIHFFLNITPMRRLCALQTHEKLLFIEQLLSFFFVLHPTLPPLIINNYSTQDFKSALAAHPSLELTPLTWLEKPLTFLTRPLIPATTIGKPLKTMIVEPEFTIPTTQETVPARLVLNLATFSPQELLLEKLHDEQHPLTQHTVQQEYTLLSSEELNIQTTSQVFINDDEEPLEQTIVDGPQLITTEEGVSTWAYES